MCDEWKNQSTEDKTKYIEFLTLTSWQSRTQQHKIMCELYDVSGLLGRVIGNWMLRQRTTERCRQRRYSITNSFIHSLLLIILWFSRIATVRPREIFSEASLIDSFNTSGSRQQQQPTGKQLTTAWADNTERKFVEPWVLVEQLNFSISKMNGRIFCF